MPICRVIWVFNLISPNLHLIRKTRVTGLEDRSSSAKSSMKGHKEDDNRLVGTVKKFCILFGRESTISICGGSDKDCTVVTLHRVSLFLISVIEQTRRSKILYVLLLTLPVLNLPFFQSNKT